MLFTVPGPAATSTAGDHRDGIGQEDLNDILEQQFTKNVEAVYVDGTYVL